MTFDETPDYDFLRELFTTAMKNNGDEDDQVYDWMVLNNGKGWEANGSVRRVSVRQGRLADLCSRPLLLLQKLLVVIKDGRRESIRTGLTDCGTDRTERSHLCE